MKLAVTSQGSDLESQVDPRFGRAKYLLVVDTETGEYLAKDNAENLNSPQGAGTRAAEAVARVRADVVLTGNVGPKAFGALQAAGIGVCTGASGRVRDAIEEYRSGRLQATTKPNVAGHWA